MKKISNIYYKIHWLMKFKSPIYINSLNIFRLYKEWKEVKDFFKKPTFKYWGKWHTKWTDIFRLELNPLTWKYKYHRHFHEEDPNIILTLFGTTWRWTLSPDKDNNGNDTSVQYYETILLLPKYLKEYDYPWDALRYAVNDNIWGDDETIDCTHMLNTCGEMFYKYSMMIHNQSSIDKHQRCYTS